MGHDAQGSRRMVVGDEAGAVGRARAWTTLNLALWEPLKGSVQGCDIIGFAFW